MWRRRRSISRSPATCSPCSGERHAAQTRAGRPYRGERWFGRFERTVTLPFPVQADKVKATYRDGVLTITLPKAEEIKPRRSRSTCSNAATAAGGEPASPPHTGTADRGQQESTSDGEGDRHRPWHDELGRRSCGRRRPHRHPQPGGEPSDALRGGLHEGGGHPRRAGGQASGHHQPREHRLLHQALHGAPVRRGAAGDQARPLQGGEGPERGRPRGDPRQGHTRRPRSRP